MHIRASSSKPSSAPSGKRGKGLPRTPQPQPAVPQRHLPQPPRQMPAPVMPVRPMRQPRRLPRPK